MNYFSTRNSEVKLGATAAIARGLAEDGGLYVPETFSQVSLDEIKNLCTMDYRQRAKHIITPYLSEFTETELEKIVSLSYADNYDTKAIAPTVFNENIGVLELWHGPTSAFKDMALQMLPHLLTLSLKKTNETRKVCILVATSGDTGKAALEGFADVEDTKILVFFPRDGVSDVQRLQMITQSGDNVMVSSVEGNFDDAQTGVKVIFGDKDLAQKLSEKGWFLSSANSINWGRLLPQIIYYFSAYCDSVNAGKIAMGDEIIFSVPTGNFGDILAGFIAKQMGLPVKKFICASNANNVLTDFINTGIYDRNRPFFTTASPSMDILISSNLERLLYMLCKNDKEVAGYMESLQKTGKYEVSDTLKTAVKADFYASYCDDADTKLEIKKLFDEKNYLMDTHTAVAYKSLENYRSETGDDTFAVVVSTASPYKFCDSVLDALGEDTSENGAKLIEKLAEKTGTIAPAPLCGLDKRAERFTTCAKKDELLKVVEEFLK